MAPAGCSAGTVVAALTGVVEVGEGASDDGVTVTVTASVTVCVAVAAAPDGATEELPQPARAAAISAATQIVNRDGAVMLSPAAIGFAFALPYEVLLDRTGQWQRKSRSQAFGGEGTRIDVFARRRRGPCVKALLFSGFELRGRDLHVPIALCHPMSMEPFASLLSRLVTGALGRTGGLCRWTG